MKKSKDHTGQQVTWVQQLTHYRRKGISTAVKLWGSDPVAAYHLWRDALANGVPTTLSKSTMQKTEVFLKELARFVAEDLYQIDAEDTRLSTTEREEVLRAQRRHKAEIPEDRKKELVDYALTSEPMTDAEVRQHIIDKRARKGLPPPTEQEIARQVQASNRGGCSMFKIVDPTYPSTIGERIVWARQQAEKGPRTKEEFEFVQTIKRLQERQKMNTLSVQLVDGDRKVKIAAEAAALKAIGQTTARIAADAPLVAIVNDGSEDMALSVNGGPRRVAPDCLKVLVAVVQGYNAFMAESAAGTTEKKAGHFRIEGADPSGHPVVACRLEQIVEAAIPGRVKRSPGILNNFTNLFRSGPTYPDTYRTFRDMLGYKRQGTHTPILFRTEP